MGAMYQAELDGRTFGIMAYRFSQELGVPHYGYFITELVDGVWVTRFNIGSGDNGLDVARQWLERPADIIERINATGDPHRWSAYCAKVSGPNVVKPHALQLPVPKARRKSERFRRHKDVLDTSDIGEQTRHEIKRDVEGGKA